MSRLGAVVSLLFLLVAVVGNAILLQIPTLCRLLHPPQLSEESARWVGAAEPCFFVQGGEVTEIQPGSLIPGTDQNDPLGLGRGCD